MRMFVAVAVGVALAGCASDKRAQAPAPAAPAAEARPESSTDRPNVDVEAALARERDPLPTQTVAFPEETFTARIEGTAPPTVTPHEGLIEVTVPLAPNARLRCFVYPEYVDPGTTLVRLVERASASVQLQQFAPTAIVAHGINPIVFAEAAYTTDKNLGLLKLAAFASDDASFLCAHDEVGYRRTFARIVGGFAQSLKAKDASRDPDFGELQVIRIAGRDVGFERRRAFVAEGRRADDVASLLLIPRSKSELDYQSSFKITETDVAGRLETLRFFESEQGAPKVQVEVSRQDGTRNTYAYQGTREGQAISGTFRSRDAEGLPGDRLIEERFARDFFSSPNATAVIEQYDPEIDPEKPLELPVTSLDASARVAQITIGDHKARARFDDDGRMERLEFDLGGTTLVQERVATVGDL